MSICDAMPSLEVLLKNVAKNKLQKDLFNRIGHSEKAISFNEAIERLNDMYGTSFYMERNGQSFTIQGHREFGHLSRRNGILGNDIDFTLGIHEIKDAGTTNTIKCIIDNNNNFIVVSLTKLRELGHFTKERLDSRFQPTKQKTIPYFTWSLDELIIIEAILYKSI